MITEMNKVGCVETGLIGSQAAAGMSTQNCTIPWDWSQPAQSISFQTQPYFNYQIRIVANGFVVNSSKGEYVFRTALELAAYIQDELSAYEKK